MELQQVLTGLEQAKAQYDALVKAASQPLREQLQSFCRDNGLRGIVWTQYTPYFNDGDECVFSVSEATIITGDPRGVDSPWDDENTIEAWIDWDRMEEQYPEDIEKLTEAGVTKEAYVTFRTLQRQLLELEDVLRIAFGDHVLVKVTPGSVQVEDYDHD